MATNIEINEKLIEEAMELSGAKTKRSVVEKALKNFVQYLKKIQCTELFGQIDFDPDYDYKKQRLIS